MPSRSTSDALPTSKRGGWLQRITGAFAKAPDEPSLTHAVLDAVPDAVVVIDEEDRIRLANDAVASLLGHAPEDLIGVEFSSTLLPLGSRKSHRARIKQHVDGSLESQQAGVANAPAERRTMVRADGTELEVEIAIRPIEGPRALFGITIRDATSTHDLEAALEATDGRRRTLRTIVDSLPDPVVAVDRNDRVVLRNEAANRLGDGDLPEPWWNDVRAVIRNGDPVFDQEEPSAAGVQLTTRVPVRARTGDVVGAVVISRDVTEQKAGEAQLLAAMQAAESAAQANREFLATTSHEVRTLMSGVTGMTMLLLNTDLDEEQREYVDTVRTSSSALLTVINDVLDFSKIESGMLHLEDEPFDVRCVADEAIRMVAQQAAGKGLALKVEAGERVPPSVRGDAGRVRQVLVNLLSNAVKFTSEGSIRIRIERTMSPSGPALLFAVKDTGVGIAPDRLEAIFEEFTQADVSTSRTHGGTGLGLAICRRLVGLMGGSMSAESEPDGGSEFRFTIALEADSDTPEPMTAAWVSKPVSNRAAPAASPDRPPHV
ncbi:ATP-binding protein, partial [Rubrivirga sp.]|uniref:sensor histidine kinase n=1 Tax=Rubrivirga sp. TaxID=1885344 RepID=UPI003C7154C1